jgi:hypothetical protein
MRRSRHTPLARRAQAITAAATRVGAPEADPTQGFGVSLPKPAEWAEKAWEYVQRIGELSYYVSWRSNAISRAFLIGATVDPLTGLPSAIEEDDRVGQLVASIVRDIGGSDQPQLLKRLTVFFTVPGEGYAAMLVDKDGNERWYAFSRDEVSATGGQKLIFTLPDKTKHEFQPELDLFFRMWDPDDRRAWDAKSPVRANLDVLQEIMRATQTIDNANSSRLIGKGVLFVPDEMNLPSQPAPRADRDTNSAPDPEWESSNSQDLQDLLFQVGTTAYKDQNSMAANFPIVAAVPGEYADKIKHITFGTDIPETALKTREAAIRRLALGLDVSPERLLGLSVGNHWSAWAIGEDDIRLHIVPVLEIIAEAFTRFVLNPALEILGIEIGSYVVHYDTSRLTQDPDRKAEALQANAVGALTNAALLRYLGFNEDDGYDLETLDGWKELARDKAARDITQLPMLAPLAAPDGGLDIAEPAALPAAEPAAPPPVDDSAPAEGDANSEPTQTAAVGRALIEVGTRRALELAGKRMMTRNNRYSVPQSAPAHEIYRHLLKPAPGDVPKLILGWDAIVSEAMLTTAGLTRVEFKRQVQVKALSALLRRS